MDIFQLNTLGITDCVLYRYEKDKTLCCLTPTVSWAFKVTAIDEISLNVTDVLSLFLEDFLLDAQQCWQSGSASQISSGFWTEASEVTPLRLEALATNNGKGECYLAIKNVSKEFDYRQQSLQSARELLITHHAVISQQDSLHDRLQKVLQEVENGKSELLAIRQAIQHLATGVVILNAQNELFLDNGVARQVLRAHSTQKNCVQNLFQLMKDVHVDTIFLANLEEQQTSWRGEVFWQNAPGGSRWLQLTVAPVFQNETLSHWVFLFTDTTTTHTGENSATTSADKDLLTQLDSRQSFKRELDKWLKTQQGFGLFIIDISEFKRVNENLGYRVGDEILKRVALRLDTFSGEKSYLARIGGNEFALLSPFSCLSDSIIHDYGRGLQVALEDVFIAFGKGEMTLSVNIGVTAFPQHGANTEDLLKNAGLALQFSKYKGKNEVTVFRTQLKTKQVELANLEAELATAIKNNKLTIHLQPIVDLSCGDTLKCEALARWTNDEGKIIPPDVFIPIAEKSGLIFALGDWLLHSVCQTLKELSAYAPNIRIAMNISGRQICDPDFLTKVQDAIAYYGISASQLAIEITETVFIHRTNTVAVTLASLRAIGITISIDDFGTGFSSLEYLKRLPIDELKIDRSFVRDLSVNNDDKVIIKAIIGLAENLGLNVVAEGVESDEQQHFLLRQNCVMAQGYLFNRPMPVQQFIDSLIAQK
ncbi:bifunctional diguanylate cyclase/phosphodiesterase [Alteromonas sp. C1M14]|uniref:putative bifunctional diguanylate cyclase/phosphodiesterase n=1 Tax=Alteromonas sp. C1M14 TaxID=2841567 RepID=UPI001C086044|nr:bifunctional diguanylate cyclase/phosphodiesterase [Alteromonas sp. C1M14]MBU2976623.1 bifunctional diguanylate cyclase/phosphodiesterase [Alteromonas sp. C1M14]